jgi:hypothetical protein
VRPIIESTQVFEYEEEGLKVNCSTVGGDAIVSTSPTSDLTAVVSYSSCGTQIGLAEVSMKNCFYTFTSATGSTAISTDIVCSSGGISITVRGFFGEDFCTITVSPQTMTGISGANIGVGTTREVTLDNKVSGIKGTRVGSILCGELSSSTGTYSGNLRFTGQNPTSQTHIGIDMD